MEEINKENPEAGEVNKKQDCGCDGDCCKPKKRNIFSILLFAVILLAALGVIGMKFYHSPSLKGDKQTVAVPGKGSCCDTTKTGCCDTKKDSACCSK
jgi:hypothetical protein